MTSCPRFGRLLTAMVTPFDKDGALDTERSAELAQYLFDNGSDGLVVNGTTGESPTINREERTNLFRAVIESAGTRGPIVANVGDNCTEDTVAFAQKISRIGVDAIMVVTPYYNKPPQEGLYRHFRAVAEAVDVPVILYNIPGRCVINIEASTIARLAHDVDNIVAVKQANPHLEEVTHILESTPQGFEVLSGDDALTLPMMKVGASGVISVLSHIAGPSMRAMIDYEIAGEFERAQQYADVLNPLADALFMTSNPIMVKDALAIEGFPVGGVRLPLVEPTQVQHEKLVSVMNETFAHLQTLESKQNVS